MAKIIAFIHSDREFVIFLQHTFSACLVLLMTSPIFTYLL